MTSNCGPRRQRNLEIPKTGRLKKDELFYARLYYWVDCIAHDADDDLRKGASGWVMLEFVRYIYPDGVIRLWEHTGYDERGKAKGVTGGELLRLKTDRAAGSLSEFINTLRKNGWLDTWDGNHGHELHSPIFKLGDIPSLHDKWPDETPIEPGRSYVSFLKKKAKEIKAKIGDHTIDTKELRRTPRTPRSQLVHAAHWAALREQKERERAGSLATALCGGALREPATENNIPIVPSIDTHSSSVSTCGSSAKQESDEADDTPTQSTSET